MPILNLSQVHREHEKFLQAHSDMVSGVLYDAGLTVVASVITHPGFKPQTGALQKATETRVVRTRAGKILRVRNAKPYARPIDRGARPHVIAAKNGGLLRFKGSNGQWVFRRMVNHPGNRPYKFLERATSNAYTTVGHRLRAGMQQVARRFGSR